MAKICKQYITNILESANLPNLYNYDDNLQTIINNFYNIDWNHYLYFTDINKGPVQIYKKLKIWTIRCTSCNAYFMHFCGITDPEETVKTIELPCSVTIYEKQDKTIVDCKNYYCSP